MSELPEERLATTDEKGNRVFLFPEDITGYWKTKRTQFYSFLIIIYLVLPWIYINGKQWILLDIPNRNFRIFGVEFFGHDGPLLFFLVAGFVLLMAFITSIWGRVWCGWACPQTVFIDTIYRRIERWVEGKARKRKALAQAPWSFEKLWKKSLKWFLYIVVSLHIVHSFLGYFVGTHALLEISTSAPAENWGLFMTMLFITGVILLDFAWFREQFCIIACPYGRFQSVAMDDDSLVVAYDTTRGEPRRTKGVPKDQEGDCINCNHCVKACPTGIDIRDGTQMECIACTMCIDACDGIMEKVKKPKGLIRYTNENKLNGKPSQKFKFRSGVYLVLLALLAIAFLSTLSLREQLQVQIFKSSKEAAYQEIRLESGEVKYINHLRVKFYKAKLEGLTHTISVSNPNLKLTVPQNDFKLNSKNYELPVFVEFDKSILNNGEKTIELIIKTSDGKEMRKEVKLAGPLK